VTSSLTYSAATLITIVKSFRGQASRITKKFRGVFEKFLTSFVIIVGFGVVVVVVFWPQRRFSKDFNFCTLEEWGRGERLRRGYVTVSGFKHPQLNFPIGWDLKLLLKEIL
jgi:hypothetical protein